jgi:superfamily II DNA or RNA helicase
MGRASTSSANREPTMKLRDYQRDLIDRARQSLRRHNSTLLVSPTGSGKTALTVNMMKGAAERGNSAWFLVHRAELLRQTSKALWEQKLEHGLIASGRKRTPMPVQVGSIQTLVNRLDQYPPPDLLVVDEAHHAVSPTYQRIVEACGAKVVGLTATPERLDGRGLGEVFEDMQIGPSPGWLIEQGFLSDYRLIAPSDVNTTEIAIRGGDFARDQTEEVMDRPQIVGDAVDAYLTHARGLRCVTFCVTRNHARHMVECYRQRGVPAEYVGGDSEKTDRGGAFERFRRGETMVLVNVDLVGEGVDIPAVAAVQMLRPTQSLTNYLQWIGRALRPDEGKHRAVILDQVGNWRRHGLPDQEREWSLDSKRRRKKKGSGDDEEPPGLSHCPECHAIFPKASVCPACGALIGGGRESPEEVDGELVEVDVAMVRKEQRRQQQQARTLEGLVQVAIDQGKKPAWAGILYAQRNNADKGRCIADAKRLYREMVANQAPEGVI